MTDLIVVPQAAHWQRLKRLVLDSVSSPITRRVYNLGLDEFFAWYGQEPRPLQPWRNRLDPVSPTRASACGRARPVIPRRYSPRIHRRLRTSIDCFACHRNSYRYS